MKCCGLGLALPPRSFCVLPGNRPRAEGMTYSLHTARWDGCTLSAASAGQDAWFPAGPSGAGRSFAIIATRYWEDGHGILHTGKPRRAALLLAIPKGWTAWPSGTLWTIWNAGTS